MPEQLIAAGAGGDSRTQRGVEKARFILIKIKDFNGLGGNREFDLLFGITVPAALWACL